MTPEEQKEIREHSQAIAKILYRNTNKEEQICSIGFGSIESTIRQIDSRTQIAGAQWQSSDTG